MQRHPVTLQVLRVEDGGALRATLRDALLLEGHQVRTAASLAEGLALATHAPPDIVLLDLGLPDDDGASLLAHLRRRGSTPVLLISARHGEPQKIALPDAGADDNLVKPFSVGALLGRMRVALRHRGTALAPAITHYRHGALLVDLAAHRVLLGEAPVYLTPTEFKLLARMVRNAGQVVTHRARLADVRGAEFVDHTHCLRLDMGQLRAKREADPAAPQRLLTEPSAGWR